jgi:hypothetical protein
MNELRRFSMKITDMGIRAVDDSDGRWCRYDDVKKILKQLTKQNARPMTNEEYAAALAKLQNEAESYKAQAKTDANTIKSLRQNCVRLRNSVNKERTLRAKEKGARLVKPCLTYDDIIRREG